MTFTFPNDFRVAQMVFNQPAIQETLVQSLGQEDPLKNGMAIPSCILAWRVSEEMDRGAWRSIIHKVTRGQT